MIKLKTNNKTTNPDLELYIKQLQAKYPEYVVNELNLNDFMVMDEERSNCLYCKGINECKNSNKGFQTKTNTNNEFYLVECKYKKQQNKMFKEREIIKTLYLPERLNSASLSSFNTNTESRRKIYNFITKFIDEFKTSTHRDGLYLYGSFSKGKTYTLACIANELSRHNINSLLIYFPDLVVDLKTALQTPRFDNLMNQLKSVDVLMLDDLGAENMTPWLRDEVLGPVINYRLMDNKPIFISSNISPKDLKSHYALNDKLKAERLISRLTAVNITVNMDDCETYQR